jgi:Putative peptidoglycan binding domain/N-acetylmuramoyl-L-alanine amidase
MSKWRGIVGKGFSIDEYASFVEATVMGAWRPSFIVLHNTSVPDTATYQKWLDRGNPSEAQWAINLAGFYAAQGWPSGPHAFALPHGRVLAFSPLSAPGTHSPAWNNRTWGLETVGEFEREPFEGEIRDTVVKVLGIWHSFLGLDPRDYKFGTRGLHFHKEDPITTHKDCPGKHVLKPDVVLAVEDEVIRRNPGGHVDIPVAVHEAPNVGLTVAEMTSASWLQLKLNANGAQLLVDDDIGPATKRAVRAFQAKHPPLVADGAAGPLTRAKLKAMAPTSSA